MKMRGNKLNGFSPSGNNHNSNQINQHVDVHFKGSINRLTQINMLY